MQQNRFWIFQARPERYDLTRQIPMRLKKGDFWTIRAFRNQLYLGQQVFFWQSGKHAGIYGTGKILEEAYERQGEWRVNVKYNPLLKSPLFRQALAKNPKLKDLSILHQARGTVFRVENGEAQTLLKLIDAHDLESPPELVEAEEQSETFNPRSVKDARQRVMVAIVRRRGQKEFRDQLLRIYDGKCAITGCDSEPALEAAHILPYKGRHTNHPQNGLLLRADLHTLFDLGLLAVDTSTMRLLLAPGLKQSSYFRELRGKRLRIPLKKANKPLKALDKHRVLFGLRLRRNKA